MVETKGFSSWLKAHTATNNSGAVERIRLAMRRIPNVLETNLVCSQRTLEQKISDQGPKDQRVDPHLLGLALHELVEHRGIIVAHRHVASNIPWYANSRTPNEEVQAKLSQLAPTYGKVSTGQFPNLIGDALEICVFKILNEKYAEDSRYPFMGSFDLDTPPKNGRYFRHSTPSTIGGHTTQKQADFIQFDRNAGPLSIECKNVREWIYPTSKLIKELIIKAAQTKTTPVLVARRIHYAAITNFLEPAGIIAHETYHQYYPPDQAELAAEVRLKRGLGFSDVIADHNAQPRTVKFFRESLPKIVEPMAERFKKNRDVLLAYAEGKVKLPTAYKAIGSPVALNNWNDDSGR